jgi:signal transduction histidine kinase
MGAAMEITELKEAQMKLEKAVSIRDEFLSVASHELRTPITSLNLQTQILQRLIRKSGESSEQARISKHLEAMNGQVKKLTSLVDDLLDVTRIANGKLILAPEKFDLSDLVRNIYYSMQEQFVNAKCHVDIVAENAAFGSWDRQKIEQVVVNLLTNACKYGRGKPIQIFVLRNKGMARLIVKDSGIGISEEYQTRIFDRFERAVRGSAFSGLGLGLFISKQIVTAHSGEISVHSQEGVGSTFTVDLPLTEANEMTETGVS